MFIYGKQRHQIDEKGRIRIPAKYRSALGENYVIMCAPGKCLFLMPEAEAERIFSKLDDAVLSDVKAQSVLKILTSSTEKPEEDKQGRTSLSKDHLKHAGIVKNIITIGVGRRAEIWAEEEWEKFAGDNNNIDESIKELAKYGI